MSFKTNDYTYESLLGNVAVDRNTLPTIRTGKRRLDPDGVSNVPYYSGATSKILRVTYTKEVVGVVTDVQVDITLTSDSLAQIIVDINATDVANLTSFDLDGFLVIQNKNFGKTHRLEINQYTTPASDAAPIIGFAQTPFPGSISYVNELASSVPNRGQGNPQGTALLAEGEDFKSSTLNRAFAALLEQILSNRIDLDMPVIGWREVEVNFVHQVASGFYYAQLLDDTIRIPIWDPSLTMGTPYRPQEKYFKIYEIVGNNRAWRKVIAGSTTNGSITPSWGSAVYDEALVWDAVYGTPGTTIDYSVPFATWGTPDGHTIFDPHVSNKDKQAATAITSIVGNVIQCAGALFVTKKVMPGDPVFLTATTKTPFDHTGWFAVDKVYDETHIGVRPMSPGEKVPIDGTTFLPIAGNRPSNINPTAGGTLRVAMGWYIPCGSVMLILSDAVAITGALVRIATAVPLREALVSDRTPLQDGDLDQAFTYLNVHLGAVNANAHPADAIRAFTSNAFADGTQIIGDTNLHSFLNDFINFLASETTTGTGDGTSKIGGDILSPLGGGSSTLIPAGTLKDQLQMLQGAQYAHENTTDPAHPAAKISYNGGGAWADGTTNPSSNVDSQLDKIVSDLASGTGGTAKISGAAVGSDLAAERLSLQIADLVNNWAKLSRANTFSNDNTFQKSLLSIGSLLLSTAANARVKRLQIPHSSTFDVTLLLESMDDASGANNWATRVYSTVSGQWFVTVNAWYDGTNWNKDKTGTNAACFIVSRSQMSFQKRDAGADTPWASFDTVLTIDSTGSSLNANLTLGSNDWVDVQGTGDYYHEGTKTLTIGGTGGRPRSNATVYNESAATCAIFLASGGTDQNWFIPIILPVGRRIKTIRAHIIDSNTGPTTISVGFYISDSSGSSGTTVTSDGSFPLTKTLTLSSLNAVVTAGLFYEVFFQRASGTASWTVLGMEVDYDYPHP